MAKQRSKYKKVKHYHEPGDLHSLTFSCYRQWPLLTNDTWRRMLAESIDRALERHRFELYAFVMMPEHVHLLVAPIAAPAIDLFLKAVKRPYSYRVRQLLVATQSPLLERLTIRERPGKRAFRVWQEGPGFDRNLNTPRSVLAAIDYIHNNPVRRGLCERPEQWKWSSARYFLSNGELVDPDLPRISRLPPEFFL